MDDTIFSLTILGFATFATLLAVDWKTSLQNLALIGLFLVILFLDNLIIVGVNRYPGLQLIPNGHWSTILLVWSGKLYSISTCLIIALLIRRVISFEELGLRLRQNNGSVLPCVFVMIFVAIAAVWIGSSWEKGPFDLIAVIYMAVMPGLNEELVYRGLLLGIINHIIPKHWNLFGANIGWGAWITSLLFGLLHGFWVGPGFTWHFLWFPVLFSGVTGLVFAWQKERTGSLLLPILTHGAIDAAIILIRMIP